MQGDNSQHRVMGGNAMCQYMQETCIDLAGSEVVMSAGSTCGCRASAASKMHEIRGW